MSGEAEAPKSAARARSRSKISVPNESKVKVRELAGDHERYAWIIQVAEENALPANATRICVLFAFDYFEGGRGNRRKPAKPFFPSHGTIARRLGIKEDTVQGIVAALAKFGFIKKWKGFGSSNRYVICFPIPDIYPGLDTASIPDEYPEFESPFDPDKNPGLAENRAEPQYNAAIPDKNPGQSRINIRGNPVSESRGGDLPDHPPTSEIDTNDNRACVDVDDCHHGAPAGRREITGAENGEDTSSPVAIIEPDEPQRSPPDANDASDALWWNSLTEAEREEARQNWRDHYNDYSED